MEKKKKVVAIGIDGADFRIIDPMIKNNELENIAKLIKQGTRGDLRSTMPPITYAAWPTFATGKNPAKHGVMDFFSPPYQNDENADFTFSNYKSIKCRTFWDLLKGTDIKVGVINLPVTYPPQPLNGFMISGMDTPSEKVCFTYPPDLLNGMKEKGINYRPDYVEFLQFKKGQSKNRIKHEVIEDYFEIEEERGKAITHLMENKSWDFLVAVLGITDRLAHHFWHFHDPADPEQPNEFKEVIKDSYRKADSIIGDILERIDEDTTVMLMSDHGFGSYNKHFFLNNWLLEKGFLYLKKTSFKNIKKFYRMVPVKKTVGEILQIFRMKKLSRSLPVFLSGLRLSFLIPFPADTPERVDWRRTTAYAAAHGIYVNIKGRTRRGIVEPGKEYEEVRNSIIELLGKTQDPEKGTFFIKDIHKKEDVLNGPYLDAAPDIYFETKNFEYYPNTAYLFKKTFKKRRFGNHKMEGILVLKGPGIKKGHVVDGAEIQDCMPTLFYCLGTSVSADFDGRVIEEAFEAEYLAEHRIMNGAYEENTEPDASDEGVYSEEDEKIIKNRLKSLGYI